MALNSKVDVFCALAIERHRVLNKYEGHMNFKSRHCVYCPVTLNIKLDFNEFTVKNQSNHQIKILEWRGDWL